MKVKDIQEQLEQLDADLDVVCLCEDEKYLSPGRAFVLFDVVALQANDAEQCRLEDGTAYLKLGKSDASTKIGIIEITSDI